MEKGKYLLMKKLLCESLNHHQKVISKFFYNFPKTEPLNCFLAIIEFKITWEFIFVSTCDSCHIYAM